MNPVTAIKYLNLLNKFKANHPKFPQFIKAAGMIADEGTVIDMAVTTSEGKKIVANIKLTAEDLRILEEIKKAKAE